MLNNKKNLKKIKKAIKTPLTFFWVIFHLFMWTEMDGFNKLKKWKNVFFFCT